MCGIITEPRKLCVYNEPLRSNNGKCKSRSYSLHSCMYQLLFVKEHTKRKDDFWPLTNHSHSFARPGICKEKKKEKELCICLLSISRGHRKPNQIIQEAINECICTHQPRPGHSTEHHTLSPL